MTTSRMDRRRARTRAALLRAAYDLMSTRSVEKTTILEITESADVGFGTFYGYFASKEEIAAAALDCVIRNLGARNRLANRAAGVEDPLLVIANSMRLTMAEMLSAPMWRWWLIRTDLLARRLPPGLGPFALEDLRAAKAAGAIAPPGTGVEPAWAAINWLIIGAVTDVADGTRGASACTDAADAALRVLGIAHEEAARIVRAPLPPMPDLPVDFSEPAAEDG